MRWERVRSTRFHRKSLVRNVAAAVTGAKFARVDDHGTDAKKACVGNYSLLGFEF
jgi:hypothetical protein